MTANIDISEDVTMASFMRLLVVFTLAIFGSTSTAALAQSPVVGVWSWQSPEPTGVDNNAIQFSPDGSFVRASQLASGAVLRSWGRYQIAQVGQNQIHIQTQASGWSPQQLCVGQNCRAGVPPNALNLVATFTSPTTLDIDGSVLRHESDSPVLHLPAPSRQILYAPTPPPSMPQGQPYATPQIHPYVTPNGPGNQMANIYHQQNKNFINGYMRGCVKNQYGQWVGCQQ